jgi:hypothetical protein
VVAIFPASSKGGGICIAFPDVCKMPAPPAPFAPIPFPNIATTAAAGQKKAKVSGGKVAQKKGSGLQRSVGDAPGTVGGVKSAVAMSEAQALRGRLSTLNQQLQRLPATAPDQWQGILQDYAVTAAALYKTLNPD